MRRAIFISYRRDDTEGEAGRLFDDLIRAFGDNSVFMDVTGINPGVDFRTAIDDNVAHCGVLLAMIGPTWTTIANHDGTRRLDDSNDFVRLEIASALGRNIAVIPVLVHDAKMPHPEQLPDGLKDLAYRNSVEITHARWNSDVQLLIGALGQYVSASSKTSTEPVHATVAVQLPPANPPEQKAPTAGKSKMKMVLGIAAAVVVLIVAVIALASHGSNSSSTTTPTINTTAENDETPATQAPATQTPANQGAASPAPADDDETDKTASPQATQREIVSNSPHLALGTWTNPAPTINNGLKALVINETNGQVTMHAWGNCQPTDCDWGQLTAAENGEQFTATWDWSQDGRVARVTVTPRSGTQLNVLIENTYSDHEPVSRQLVFDRAQ